MYTVFKKKRIKIHDKTSFLYYMYYISHFILHFICVQGPFLRLIFITVLKLFLISFYNFITKQSKTTCNIWKPSCLNSWTDWIRSMSLSKTQDVSHMIKIHIYIIYSNKNFPIFRNLYFINSCRINI